MEIASFQNDKIKNLLELKKSSQKKRKGKFVAEGYREISLAIKAGFEIKQLFVCKKLNQNKKLDFNIDDNKIFEVNEKIFKRISFRENPDGFIAIFQEQKIKLEEILVNESSLFLILDKIEKPGNLGAALRTAEAANLDAVIVSDDSLDIYNHNAIRASQGAIFNIKVVSEASENIIKWLQKNKVKIFATTPHTNQNYLDVDYQGKTAIVMGSEDKGLSQKWLGNADEKIKIKMRGQVDSLNISVAAAIVVFEALRQRG